MGKMLEIIKNKIDGWENTITSLGRTRDKRSYTVIKATPIQGSREEFDALYHGDHTCQKIAKLPAREMTRQWIKMQVDDSGSGVKNESTEEKMITAKQVMQALDDLSARSKVAQALIWARVHGGSLLFLGVDDGADDLSQPLNIDNVKSFDFLLVFDRWDVQIQSVNIDLKSKDFGKPEIYLLQPQTQTIIGNASALPVHASRFVRVEGVPTSAYRMSMNSGWSDSVYTAMKETIQDFGMAWHSVAHLLYDFSQGVFKMKGLADAIAASEDDLVLNRISAMDMCRSVGRAIPIDSEDEDFTRVATPMSGLPETMDRFMLRVSEAAEIPATLLFGQSPAGLNATGESDIRFFYDQIKAMQEETLRPVLDRILDVLFASKSGPTKGSNPDNWSYEFNPLWQETDQERAATRKIQAETDQIYLESGVLDEDEIAMSRFGGDSYSTETILDMEKRLAEPEEEYEPEPIIIQQPMPVPSNQEIEEE